MAFSDIPLRANGQRIVQSWYNILRTAGISLENYLGAAFLQETTFSIANNTGPSNVTGLVFSGASVRSAFIDYYIYRNTTGGGATERSEAGTLVCTYKTVAASWEIAQQQVGDAGVALTITSSGQIQYTSDNQTGTPATSKMVFRARTFAV